MPHIKLSKRSIEELPLATDKGVIYWDTETPGFGLVVGRTKKPQTRKRVFIFGIREDVRIIEGKWPPVPTHDSPENDAGLPVWVTASSVFENDLVAGDANNIRMNHSKALIDVFKSTPKNGGSRSQSSRVLPCHKYHNGHKDVYGRIDPRRPGPTMTTSCTNPSKGRFVHPTRNHGITVRHAARFQTFPDDFIFCGGIISASRQVGNAVPIRLGQAVIKSILEGLQ